MLLKYNLDNDVCDPHPLLIGAALQPKNALSLPKNKKKNGLVLTLEPGITPGDT